MTAKLLARKQTLLWVGAGLSAVLFGKWLKKSHKAFSFRDKVVLITGGSRGLGLLLARELAQEGARIALCARDEEELASAKDELHIRYRADVATFICDVTDRGQVEAMVARVKRRLGDIDVLINNAGQIQVGPLEEMTIEDYEEAMKIHFWAPLYTTLAVLPDFRAKKSGRIGNISSIGGKISAPHLAPYTASKFALTGLSHGLRVELEKAGIYVTTIIPGLMRTGSPEHARFKGQHRKEYSWFAISDALPGFSMNAEAAAKQICEAIRAGKAEIVLSLPAKFVAKSAALFPNLVDGILGMVNRTLPEPGGIGNRALPGAKSHSPFAPSVLTKLGDSAAERNNEKVSVG
jgi:short-subunit dehydrogenase